MRVQGYDGVEYGVGERVELHPGTDLWMRGARYGTVTKIAQTKSGDVMVRVDVDRLKHATSGTPDTFRKV